MSTEYKYLNQAQDYELNYHLQKHGFGQTKENRDRLRNALSPWSTHAEVDAFLVRSKR